MPEPERPEVAVVDRAHLRAEYFTFALVMSLAEGGIDRESLREMLKEARSNLDDRQYVALQDDIKTLVLGGEEP